MAALHPLRLQDYPQPQLEQLPPPRDHQHPRKLRQDEQSSYKNRLQEYTQRAGLDLPVYHIENKALPHASRFKCLVTVDGETYESTNTFPNKKAAEQDAAKCALEGILGKRVEKGLSIISKNITLSKAILNEFAVKLQVERPKYDTVQAQAIPLPIFVSSLEFKGVSYSGRPARNKREAEQMTAYDVIVSILGNSQAETSLLEIIKSKAKLCSALQLTNESNCAIRLEDESKSGGVDGDCTGKQMLLGSDVLMPTSNDKQFKDARKACDLQTEGVSMPASSPNPAATPIQSFANLPSSFQNPAAAQLQSSVDLPSSSQNPASLPIHSFANLPSSSQNPSALSVHSFANLPSSQNPAAPSGQSFANLPSSQNRAAPTVHSFANLPFSQNPAAPSGQSFANLPSTSQNPAAPLIPSFAIEGCKIVSASQADESVLQTLGAPVVFVPSMQDSIVACSSHSSKKRNRKNRKKAKKKARSAMQAGVTHCSAASQATFQSG